MLLSPYYLSLRFIPYGKIYLPVFQAVSRHNTVLIQMGLHCPCVSRCALMLKIESPRFPCAQAEIHDLIFPVIKGGADYIPVELVIFPEFSVRSVENEHRIIHEDDKEIV